MQREDPRYTGTSASQVLRQRDLTVDQLSLILPEVGFDGLFA